MRTMSDLGLTNHKGHPGKTLTCNAGLKRTGKANQAKRLCFDSPFERRPGASLTAGVVERHPQ